MKKYVKPALFMESFEMTEHIAQCGINHSNNDWDFQVNNHYAESCSFSIEGGDMTFFVSDACANDGILVDKDFKLDGLCYEGNHAADTTIFFS